MYWFPLSYIYVASYFPYAIGISGAIIIIVLLFDPARDPFY